MTPIYPNPREPVLKAALTIIKERQTAVKPPAYEPYRPAKHNPDHTGYRQGIRPNAMTGVK